MDYFLLPRYIQKKNRFLGLLRILQKKLRAFSEELKEPKNSVKNVLNESDIELDENIGYYIVFNFPRTELIEKSADSCTQIIK